MGVVVADVTAHRSELSPSSDPHPSQPEGDPTAGLARGVEDEGPEDSLLAQTDPLSEASAQDPPVGTDDSYEVTWTVDIAMAFPRGEDEASWDGRGKRAEGVPEAPRVQSYYHLEYHLLPQHSEPVRVDLAMFGPVVKIYRNSESKALRPWCEGDRAWVSWSHSFSVSVTGELLQELLSHRILFRLWEGKDKVCSKARYDRPRAFRPPPARPEEEARVCGIRNMVSRLRELTQKDNSKMSRKNRNTTVEIQRPSHEETQKDGSSVKPQERSQDTAAFTGAQQSEATAADLESMKRNGIAWAESSPLCLLAGATSLAESFSVVCPSAVREALFSVSLDRALMSEQLKAQLNPLVITIVSANSMPSTPVPLHALQEKCLPVYCQYQFLKSKTHKTKPQCHGTRVYFGDVFVVLAGAMGRGELREYLTGPPLEIQVHDRDRKPEKPPGTPGLFGTRPDDDKLSSVAFVSRKRSGHRPAAAQARETYAVAHLDLSELLLGRRSLKVNLPIRSCPPPQLLGRERPMWERKMMDLPGVAEGHGSKPMEQGHYFDSDAHLKVKVEVAHPLLGGADPTVGSCDCPLFGRIVFIFGSNNVHVRTKLRSEILKINTAAFNIGSCPSEFLDRVLTDYLLSPEECESKDLDFVTGFHVQDEKMHLVVVEGLRHKAVRSLWETVPQRLGGPTEEQVRVLYSSGLGFSKRVYGSLDVNLSPVRLHRPLEDIMRNPLVYVRDMLPHSCFQALSRLSQLCQARQLLEALRRDLFPTEDMILSVSRELGTLPGKTEKKPQVEEEEEEEREEVQEEPVVSSLAVWQRRHEPLDMHNTEYIQWKRLPAQQQGRHIKDYVKENIRELQLRSLPVQKPRLAVWGPAVVGPVHNYSIQTFNSHRQGLERLREEMAKVPGRRFTYSQRYQSATVEPTGFTPAPRAAGAAFDCHLPRDHPPRPDQSRVDELSKPWRENVLHTNTLKPPLTRDRWPWARRSLDFQLYITPPPFFGPPRSECVHLAGEGLHEEQLAVGRRTPDVRSAGGPVPEDHGQLPDFKCYLGAGSGKFQEILKDEPRKYSLRKPGLALKPLPGLAVLGGGAEESQNKALAPGPYPEKNFTATNNTIPRRPSLYKEYRFKRYCTPRSLLHKRRCSPLTGAERARHAARGPQGKTHPQNTATARPFKNLVEVRTHREVTVYAQ